MLSSEASTSSALTTISKLAEAFDNFEVWLFMSLAHGRGLWPMASCSAFRSQASGSRAGPLLPNRSAVKYRPRKASAKWPPAGRAMSILYWFYTSKWPSHSKTHYKITNLGGGLPPAEGGPGCRPEAGGGASRGRGARLGGNPPAGPPEGRPVSIF